MRPLKRVLKSSQVSAFISRCICCYLRFVYRTGTWKAVGHYDTFLRISAEGKPVIALFWHGRLAMPFFFSPPDKQGYALISKHRDGALLAGVMERLGVKTIAGSTSKGGASAIKACLRALKQGAMIVVTPDGPRGPREEMSGHITAIAARSGAYIAPMSYDCTRKKHFNSWDNFLLPLPFTKGVIYFEEPFQCNSGEEEQANATAQRLLDNAGRQATALLASD